MSRIDEAHGFVSLSRTHINDCRQYRDTLYCFLAFRLRQRKTSEAPRFLIRDFVERDSINISNRCLAKLLHA